MKKLSEKEAERFLIRAYPQLNKTPELMGYNKFCFEFGFVLGYIIFYVSKDLPVTILSTFFLITIINFYLKQDPKFFEIRRKAKNIHTCSLGFFKAYEKPKQKLRTVHFL